MLERGRGLGNSLVSLLVGSPSDDDSALWDIDDLSMKTYYTRLKTCVENGEFVS